MKTKEFIKEATNLFPDLKIKSIKEINGGYTSSVFLVNNEVIFKVPLFLYLANCIEREADVIKQLYGKTTLEIPKLLYKAKTSSGLPIVGESVIKGETLTLDKFRKIPIRGQNIILSQIGEFIKEIQKTKPRSKVIYRFDRTSNIEYGEQGYTKTIQKFFSSKEKEAIERILECFKNCKKPEKKFVFSHADLHFKNIIKDPKKNKIAGIIDFGSACYIDKYYDLKYFYNSGVEKIAKAMGQELNRDAWTYIIFHRICNQFNFLTYQIEHKRNYNKELKGIRELIKYAKANFL